MADGLLGPLIQRGWSYNVEDDSFMKYDEKTGVWSRHANDCLFKHEVQFFLRSKEKDLPSGYEDSVDLD
jgi:hypothetical protein